MNKHGECSIDTRAEHADMPTRHHVHLYCYELPTAAHNPDVIGSILKVGKVFNIAVAAGVHIEDACHAQSAGQWAWIGSSVV